jgi:LacI family transcriptional regulator
MKVRLKEVAAQAGVAINTASTILNRRPNSWASKETEERVFRAAAELGYRPNRTAVALRFGRFNTLALLIPDLHNPYYTAFADLLEIQAEAAGFDLLIESWRMDLAREKERMHEIMNRQVDGAAAFLSDQEAHRPFLLEQQQEKRPFVALSAAGGDPLPVDSVLADFTPGFTEAVETLYQLGHRRFAFLCALADGQEDGKRPEVFRQLLRARGLGDDSFIFTRCGPSLDSAHFEAGALFERRSSRRPTALIALNDLSAIGAMRAAADRNWRVPHDLSVVGVDNIPSGKFLPVSLSTIAQPIEAMARSTATMLVERITHSRNVEPRRSVFPTQFIRRESVGHAHSKE